MTTVFDSAHPGREARDEDVARLRVPPQSIEAEQSVLGGLLLDNGAWDRAADVITSDDFYRFEHKLIFGAIGALVAASKPADVITVFEQLKNLGHAEEVGRAIPRAVVQQQAAQHTGLRLDGVRRHAQLRDLAVAREVVVDGRGYCGHAVLVSNVRW